MNVSGVGVNSSLGLLKAGSKSGMTNAIAAGASSAGAAVNAGKLGSIAGKAWNGIKNIGMKAWEGVIKPAAMWVWNKALKPVGELAAKGGKAVWDKALKPVGDLAAKAGKAVWEKALKPAGEAISKLAQKVAGKGGEAIGAISSMSKGTKIGLIAGGVALVATGIGLLIRNHKAKKAEQAEAV